MKKIILNVICSVLLISLVAGCGNNIVNRDEVQNNKNEQEEIIYEGKWGTSSPIKFKDNEYGLIEIVGYGDCSYKINDSSLINNEYVEDDIFNSLRSAFSYVIPQFSNDFYSLMYSKEQLEKEMLKTSNEIVTEGVEIISVNILAINLTEDSKKIVDQQNDYN